MMRKLASDGHTTKESREGHLSEMIQTVHQRVEVESLQQNLNRSSSVMQKEETQQLW